MPAYQDGSFPYGAPTLTTGASITYICTDFQISKSDEIVNISNNVGAHVGALAFEAPKSGTAEVQFANSTHVEPTTVSENATQGLLINVNIRGANVNCMVTSVSIRKPSKGNWTATLGWQAKAN